MWVEVYQDKGWSHEALLLERSSLSIDLQSRDQFEREKGIQYRYEYQLKGEAGSHIIPPIRLVGRDQNGHAHELFSTEVFVDIGIEKTRSELSGLLPEPQSTIPWMWLALIVGFLMLVLLRKKQRVLRILSTEDRYRKQWQECFHAESDPILRASTLSVIVREYLEVRYEVALIRATPEEAMQIAQNADWPVVIQDAVIRVFDQTDMIRFAGQPADDSCFAELTRNLEVILTIGENHGI